MDTMAAVVATAWGGPEVLEIQRLPIPTPQAGEVRVRVAATGVNPVDAKTRASGGLLARKGTEPPVVLGWDVSGTVDAVGEGVGRFHVGDEVFGLVRFPRVGAAYAEYVCVPEEQLAAKPTTVDHVQAASTPMVGLTVIQGLRACEVPLEGATVLIHAAAGGTGSMAVQIAKARGARVAGTASSANQDLLRALGVDVPIDYTQQRFEDLIGDVDVVWDSLGGETQARSWAVMRPGAAMVCITRPPREGEAEEHGMRAVPVLVRASGPDMMELAGLLQAEVIRPVVGTTMTLAEVAEAHAALELGHARGKTVLTI